MLMIFEGELKGISAQGKNVLHTAFYQCLRDDASHT